MIKREILYEKVTSYGQPDPGDFETDRERSVGSGALPPAWYEQRGVLQVTLKVQRHGCFTVGPDERAGAGKCPPEKDVCRRTAQARRSARGARKKVVRPSLRAKMAKETVDEKRLSIRQACTTFCVSERSFRYTGSDPASAPTMLQNPSSTHRSLITQLSWSENIEVRGNF